MSRTPLFRILARSMQSAAGNAAAGEGRRAFLKSALAAGLAVPAAQLLAVNHAHARLRETVFKPRPQPARDPIMIVGAGLAGLVTAYRLMRAGIACEVYEASERAGGRVLTQKNFNSEGMFCELGGELIDSTHTDLIDLARELGLAFDDVRPYSATRGQLFFFGGQRYYDEDLLPACQPLIRRILPDMKKIYRHWWHPTVNYHDHTAAAVRFDHIPLAEYLESMKGDVDRWVLDAVRVAYEGEFGLDAADQSCINLALILNTDSGHTSGLFGESDESMRLRGGNSSLVEALRDALAGHVPIHYGRKLQRIRDAGGLLELTFANRKGTAAVARKTPQVVCTIPFSTLREVEGLGALGLSPVKLRCINELGYGTNSKRMIGFRERIWRTGAGGIAAYSGDSYSDLSSQTFWDTSRSQNGVNGIITNFIGGKGGLDESSNTFEGVMGDLERIQPGISAYYDGHHSLFRWASHPHFKGSYACARPGQHTTIMGSQKESELKGRLLFAGEHTSERSQGYMNGAVESANRTARYIALRFGRLQLLGMTRLLNSSP